MFKGLKRFQQAPGSLGQKAKMAQQMFKIQKQMSGLSTEYESKGIKVVIKGGGLISAPQVGSLEFEDEIDDEALIKVLNEALKESHKKSLKKLQEVGGDFQGGFGA